LNKLQQDELRLKQEIFDKQNIEKQKQELLIEIEKEKKENINFKYKYGIDTQNFKKLLKEKEYEK
jgi:hypothetical protein